MKARGLKLRPGLAIDDFSDIVGAIADGLIMRAIGDPEARVIDHDQRRTLLGKAILAMIIGCVEQAENAANMTLEETVHALVYNRPGEFKVENPGAP